ncbi:rod-binding protein [Agrobacterium rhizogenes]|uniref:rod-binding protein n=1 Tax=Rhizobium rhizogenes TaxID=359 RepID=UPI000645C401|nr:rod-binding protein [Rhizobium rhizogenes]OCJ26714.1 rod-binding protein [Agrobacterium sp. B133/95]NTF86112.1 rod-binding protein [Rhizobium rhizogenes]NTG49644.1 rod-binding protein [Rhizobium rhizogenes]NTG72484.1 rod-binding protein [Rhizobium rhizogenes]NTG85180.1 rod-binding protein [Rhizobium rhizogenes]
MAISPPSDLVLDVVQAASPTDVQAAQEKLAANRAAFAATSLAENGNGFGSTVDALNSAATQAGLANANTHTGPTKVPQVYRKFEAMVLQNFVKNMLPNSETLYGKGSAGEIWKGMMAEQMGNTLAKNGGVGIAEKMYQDEVSKMRNTGAINSATNENDKKMALSAVADFQRKTLAASETDGDGDTTVTNQDALTSKKA